jgi:hypothetical protein
MHASRTKADSPTLFSNQMQAFDMLRGADHFGSSHVTVTVDDISLTRGVGANR